MSIDTTQEKLMDYEALENKNAWAWFESLPEEHKTHIVAMAYLDHEDESWPYPTEIYTARQEIDLALRSLPTHSLLVVAVELMAAEAERPESSLEYLALDSLRVDIVNIGEDRVRKASSLQGPETPFSRAMSSLCASRNDRIRPDWIQRVIDTCIQEERGALR